jgi:hypothetical protein
VIEPDQMTIQFLAVYLSVLDLPADTLSQPRLPFAAPSSSSLQQAMNGILSTPTMMTATSTALVPLSTEPHPLSALRSSEMRVEAAHLILHDTVVRSEPSFICLL